MTSWKRHVKYLAFGGGFYGFFWLLSQLDQFRVVSGPLLPATVDTVVIAAINVGAAYSIGWLLLRPTPCENCGERRELREMEATMGDVKHRVKFCDNCIEDAQRGIGQRNMEET